MKVVGRDGVDLHDAWGGDARAYMGMTVPGFPNLFCLYGPNTNIVVNGSIIFFSEAEVHYVTQAVRHLLEHDLGAMECRPDVHDAYNERVDAGNLRMAWGVSTCRPGTRTDSAGSRRTGRSRSTSSGARPVPSTPTTTRGLGGSGSEPRLDQGGDDLAVGPAGDLCHDRLHRLTHLCRLGEPAGRQHAVDDGRDLGLVEALRAGRPRGSPSRPARGRPARADRRTGTPRRPRPVASPGCAARPRRRRRSARGPSRPPPGPP